MLGKEVAEKLGVDVSSPRNKKKLVEAVEKATMNACGSWAGPTEVRINTTVTDFSDVTGKQDEKSDHHQEQMLDKASKQVMTAEDFISLAKSSKHGIITMDEQGTYIYTKNSSANNKD